MASRVATDGGASLMSAPRLTGTTLPQGGSLRSKGIWSQNPGLARLSIGRRQFADLDRPAGFEVRIADQQGLRLVEILGAHPQVAGQMRRHRSGHAALAHAHALADGAAALEASGLLQLVEIGLPVGLADDGVIVHDEDVLGHVDLLSRSSQISKVDEARPGPWPKGSRARSLSEAPAGPIGSAYCAARLSRPEIRRVPLSASKRWTASGGMRTSNLPSAGNSLPAARASTHSAPAIRPWSSRPAPSSSTISSSKGRQSAPGRSSRRASSGRNPRTTGASIPPAASASRSREPSPSAATSGAASLASRKFIGGEPMKPAT